MDEITFLDKDYERKINFLNEQSSRKWTKFNIFFTIESTLIGGKFLLYQDKAGINTGFAIFGLALSLVWYVVGAHDQYLVAVFQNAVKQAADKLMGSFKLLSYPDPQKDYRYVGDEINPDVKQSIFRWNLRHRNGKMGMHLSSFFPLVLIILWAIYLIILLNTEKVIIKA